jgi:hypothetical protein
VIAENLVVGFGHYGGYRFVDDADGRRKVAGMTNQGVVLQVPWQPQVNPLAFWNASFPSLTENHAIANEPMESRMAIIAHPEIVKLANGFES